jgi:hypothetical protein
MEDLDLPPELAADAGPAPAAGEAFVAPPPGVPAAQRWVDKRTALAAEHAAAGQFAGAMSLLYRQLGVVNFDALKPYMLDLYNASHAALPGLQVGARGCCYWQGRNGVYMCREEGWMLAAPVRCGGVAFCVSLCLHTSRHKC